MKWFEKLVSGRRPDLIVEIEGKVYMKRWWVIPRNRFLNIFLHKFVHSDEPVLHDHPWPSISYYLKGRLAETFPDGGRLCQQGKFYYRSASQLHYLTKVDQQSVWTLFFTGPKLREWGFRTDKGWIPHFLFTNRPGANEQREYKRAS
ncbi:MAG: hypothetical protein G3M70_07185 [Candidatus Nitronauta litoralis]|uniref:Cupin domain-containing protein n=1 Tax=Candidatus Nitronauta litoralis TaxID=2705533 RepID=A0A7T0FZX5_9BACT|nr:MAG: hypothetical protein G3M70_07185 [Candidatus Nitronauta litoralis]